jgi:hypothetical protein
VSSSAQTATFWLGNVKCDYERSTEELVNALRSAPSQWTDAAIVVAFDNRFEFVKEDTPDATGRLKLIGLVPTQKGSYTHGHNQ